MFILEIEGKTYNFFRKDLDIADEPKRSSPKHTSPVGGSSPASIEANRIAERFLKTLETVTPGIADKVIGVLCKRRTSKEKSPRTSPKRTSPKGRRSVKTCKDDEEISIKTGRCIKRCNPDQVRNPDTNRCVKAEPKKRRSSPGVKKPSKKKTPPKIKTPSPPKSHVSDDDLIIEGETGSGVEERVRLRSPRSPPRSPPSFTVTEEEEEPVTQFVTEGVEESPFESGTEDVDDEDFLDVDDEDFLVE